MGYVNASGYRDPVMQGVMKIQAQQKTDQQRQDERQARRDARAEKCLKMMRQMANLAGFDVRATMMIMDRVTKKEYVL